VKHLPFEILFEDRDVIVIDKPAGMLVTHTRAREERTVEALLTDYVRKGQLKSRRHVTLVQRLDRDTSGVMMVAKTDEVAEYFRSNWNAITEKTYLARVTGVLEEETGAFESYLRDDPKTCIVRSVADPKQGKLARTEWRKVSVRDGTTLVEVSLKSGRKNQIRVHFSEAGHPLVGDVKYGGPRASRLYLHATRLRFVAHSTHEWLQFDSPTTLPEPK